MGLFDWQSTEADDEDQTVTLIGYVTPEFEENLRATLDDNNRANDPPGWWNADEKER
jgi:hypothetical protein